MMFIFSMEIIDIPESKVKTQLKIPKPPMFRTHIVSHLTVSWAAQTRVQHHDLV